MRKLFCLLGLFFIPLVFLFIGKANGSNSADLLTAPQLELKQYADVASLPASLNGNIDCIQDGPYDCVIDTNYGKFSSSGYVKRNKTDDYLQLISFVDNRPRSIPIPNSNTIINYTTEPPFGFYLYFTENFAGSVVSKDVFGTKQYQINRLYDARLVDKAGHRLAADYASMSFSANGQWMVVSMPNVAMLRINLNNYEVTPFAAGFNYTIGLDPGLKTAISNDGRYAVVASKSFGKFNVYDLSTCGQVPDTINGPVTCQSRNLQSEMQSLRPGYISVGQARFLTDNTLKIYADYNDGAHKIAPFVIYPQGFGLHQQEYMALGDSYISGEGAYNYLEGTNTSDNKCHISLTSYPFLLAHDLNYNSFHSVACSGAKIADITNTSKDYNGQLIHKVKRGDYTNQEINDIFSNFKPGYIDQLDFVTAYQPQIITLSISGNNIGFSKILENCIAFWHVGSCYNSYEDRLELVREINAQFPSLVSTYQTLKNSSPPDTRIYVIGYPQIIKANGNCGDNVKLNADETVFAEQLVDYLDTVIKQAAAKAGVFYVDAQNSFYGHRLCEPGLGDSAMNGLTRGSDFPKVLGGLIHWPLGNETYHPTPFGYALLRDRILAATNNLTSPMPAANPAASPPAESGLAILSAPASGRAVKQTISSNNLISNTVIRGTTNSVSAEGLIYSLQPSSSYKFELHSDPIALGNYSTDSKGNLSAQVLIPANTPAGFHTLHIYGTNVTGDPIDLYEPVYVAASLDDYNGDGIPNDTDPCVIIPAANTDYDQDSVDDACDGLIGEPPAVQTPATGTQPAASTSTISVTTTKSQAISPNITPVSDNLNNDILNPGLAYEGLSYENNPTAKSPAPEKPQILSKQSAKPVKSDSLKAYGIAVAISILFIFGLTVLL